MKRAYTLPPANAFSPFMAAILLAYALAQYVRLPAQNIHLRLLGVYLNLPLSVDTLTNVLVAGLVASGMEGLLHTHPAHRAQSTYLHWLLPTLSAWVLGLSLRLLRAEQTWWIGVLLGGVVLILVCLAEYVVLDPGDRLYPWAAAGLTALAFGLFLALAMGVHAAEMRLILRVPALAAGAALVCLRVFHLYLPEQSNWLPTYASMVLAAQTAAVLHYLPLTPARYGMMMLAPVYALFTWIRARARQETRPWLEAGVVALLLAGSALWL